MSVTDSVFNTGVTDNNNGLPAVRDAGTISGVTREHGHAWQGTRLVAWHSW